MDLEIRFKKEPKELALLYLKNVDQLLEDDLTHLSYFCEHALTSCLYTILENENVRLHLALEYDFLDKKDLLNRVFNGIPICADFDCASKFNKREVEKTLKERILSKYKKTNDYQRSSSTTLEK